MLHTLILKRHEKRKREREREREGEGEKERENVCAITVNAGTERRRIPKNGQRGVTLKFKLKTREIRKVLGMKGAAVFCVAAWIAAQIAHAVGSNNGMGRVPPLG